MSPPHITFPYWFFPRFSTLFVACPDCYPLPQAPWPIFLLLNAFGKCLGSHPSPKIALSQAKQRQALVQVLYGATKKVETHNHNFLRLISIFLPWALATYTRNTYHCLHGCCSGDGEWWMGNLKRHSALTTGWQLLLSSSFPRLLLIFD